MKRCTEALRLMHDWYSTAEILNGDPQARQKVEITRDNPKYQEAYELYRYHIQICTECKKDGRNE